MTMQHKTRLLSSLLVALFWTGIPALLRAAPDASAGGPAEVRDGQHDFDFEIGSWKIHLKRLKDRLAGSHEWVDYDGTSITRKVWNGKSNLNEFESDGGGGHIEGLTLRTYNPQTHEWSIYWANSKDGKIDVPQVGTFKDGVGEFYAMDTWKGRSVLVRFRWTKTDSTSPHFEQSYSDDGGKTWEVNWITDQTRTDGSDKSR